MEKKHREIIIQKLIPLTNSIHDFQEILQKSFDYGIFTPPMILDITDNNSSYEDQKKNFFLHLTRRGPEAFEKFIEILRQTEHDVTIDILTSESTQPDCASAQLNHGYNSFTESYPCKQIGTVKVKNAMAFNGGNLFTKNIYKMTSKPKGLALIIVNKHFEDPMTVTRDGADVDLRLMSGLLKGLDYKTYEYFDITKKETEDTIQSFKKEFEKYKVDSCVIAISTHGEEGALVCSDNKLISSRLLIEEFNNKNCPLLRGKPKMFFIQACRGDNTDPGQPLAFDQADAAIQTGKGLSPPENERPHLPTSTDMIAVYPSQLGYQSYRNERFGSWFFNAITKVFMNNAWKEEFQSMLNEVTDQLSRYRTYPDSEKQSTHVENMGWRKKLYFNPGLYEKKENGIQSLF